MSEVPLQRHLSEVPPSPHFGNVPHHASPQWGLGCTPGVRQACVFGKQYCD